MHKHHEELTQLMKTLVVNYELKKDGIRLNEDVSKAKMKQNKAADGKVQLDN